MPHTPDSLRFENQTLRALSRFVLKLDVVGLAGYVLETATTLLSAVGGTLVLVTEGKPVVAACRGVSKESVARVHAAAAGAPSASSAASRVAAVLQNAASEGRRVFHSPIHIDREVVAHCLLLVERAPTPEDKERIASFLEAAGLALQQAQLVHGAAFDRATGIHTADFFGARLDEEVSRAVRYKRRMALLLLVLDNFDVLRDVSGPVTAEHGLRTAIDIFRSGLRRVDILGRYREHGFAVILPETGLPPALALARRLAKRVTEAGLPDGSRIVTLSLSGAVTGVPQDARDADVLWARSAELLEAAQRQGGGRVITRKDAGADTTEPDAAGHSEIDQLVLSKEGRALLRMVARMAAGRDMGLVALQQHVIQALVEIARCDRGALVLADGEGRLDPSQVRYGHGAHSEWNPFALNLPSLQAAVQKSEPIVWNPRPPGEEDDEDAHQGRKRRAWLCAPVLFEKRLIGAIQLEQMAEQKLFMQEDVDLVHASLEVLAGILQGARIEERRQKEFIEVKEVAERALSQLEERFNYANIIGKSKSMQSLFTVLERVAVTRHSVLIQGESGTGKELVARAIHYNGPRRDKPFVAENCAALPGELLEAELFGYLKGAFTGAVANKKGLLEVAHNGTMFLDEIGDMSPNLQTKLLRVLEDKEFRPLGGKGIVRTVDVRFISATNRDLKKMIAEGTFREDLFYRLNVVCVKLPPLRERKEDIPLLVDHFLQTVANETSQPKKQMTSEAMRLLLAHDWPGNIRELENTIKNVCVFTDGPVLNSESFAHLEKFRALPLEARTESTSAGESAAPPSYQALLAQLEEMEGKFILDALAAVRNNKLHAAKLLGVTRPALYRAMKRLRIRE